MTSPRMGQHAVVIGAGLGGLTAARALADHFEQVTVLDRDELPALVAPRTGTPQARHVHVLLSGGMKALTELFPSFEADIVQAGAVLLRGGLDVRVERPGFDPFPTRDLGLHSYAMSRPALEFVVRLCLKRQANVRLLPKCSVSEITVTADAKAVTGVHYEDANGGHVSLAADWVVDASGRGGPTLALLRALKRPALEEVTIGVDIGYATATFETPPDADPGWKGVMTFPQAPHSSRGALLLPLEGRRWMLSMCGRGADKPPGDEAGFMAYVRQLRTPTIYNAIQGARRVDDIVRYVFSQSMRRHFERGPPLPQGLLPFADSVCHFNPVYGQGMSVAAQEAVLLRKLLARHSPDTQALRTVIPAFLGELQALLDTPWAMSAIPDFVFPDTVGQRPPDLHRSLQFGIALGRLAARKPDVHKLMAEVQNLLKPRSVYRRPMLLARLLLDKL